ncbi:MAG: Calx-beta domain-containing protein, partial [Nitrospinota bacterium]
NGTSKDFQLTDGVLIFKKGELSKSIPGLTVTDDSVDNGDRTFVLQLSDPTGAKLGSNNEHVYRIIDNDGKPSVYFEVVKSEGKEEVTPAKIKVQLSNNPQSADAIVGYEVVKLGSTASENNDFTVPTTRNLTFDRSKNELVKTIDVDIKNDTENERDETILLKLTTTQNANLAGENIGHTFIIKANDGGEVPAVTAVVAKKVVNDEKKKLQDAIERVQIRLPQMENPLPENRIARLDIGRKSELNTKEVMDQLIKTLKYEHIQAVRAGGEKSGAVKHLEEALSAAYEHRAGMVAIRPAFAYLRNSFPSTSLQDDADLGWKNLLRSRVFRGLFGECKDCQEKNRRRINREIDKQFWQNINRIRVSGGGDTNYVLAKDDIGNWTVKNYSADPKDIINSARNLAMFNIGQSMGANLPMTKNTPAIPGTDGTPAPNNEPSQNQTRLEASYEKFEEDYIEKAKKDLETLHGKMVSIPKNLKSNWEKRENAAFNNVYIELLERSKENHLDPRLAVDLDETNPGNDIILSLQSLELFGTNLIQSLRSQSTSAPANLSESERNEKFEPEIKQAVEEVKIEVLDYIKSYVRTRLIAVRNFEMAVSVFSETVSN